MRKTLEDIERRAKNVTPAAAAVHADLLRQMRTASIPTPTGRLAASLRSQNGDHIFEVTRDGYKFGSRDPAARYNPAAVPRVDTAAVAAVLADYVLRGEK